MPSVCFYFQVHQPYRMRPYHIFDIGQRDDYFDDKKNAEVCRKVAAKCYLPANRLMLDLIKKHPGKFKISYSISGVALEQFEEYAPEVLSSFQELARTGQVEFLAETYYHSLASIFQADEFRQQIALHGQAIQRHFSLTPTVFRNTELIYSDGIADIIEELGYRGMITEGADHVLGWRSPNFVYDHHKGQGIKLLLKNYKLSDDIAFRFSQSSWKGWPLTAAKFAHWLHSLDGNADTINLFMDYETIGEHQWADTGIFDFFKNLPDEIFKHEKYDFATPSEVLEKYPTIARISIPHAISWADTERDLSAWLGNPMQDNSIAWVYALEKPVKRSKDPELLHRWRKLQTSDHFYYMCTKFWNDGDVHKYFSVYDTPHDSYTILSNILTDFELRLKERSARATKDRPTLPTKRPASQPKKAVRKTAKMA